MSTYYRSSTTVGSTYGAWVVHFRDGNNYDFGKLGYYRVRAVRSEQIGLIDPLINSFTATTFSGEATV